MKRIARLLSLFAALISSLLFVRSESRAGLLLWYPKLLAGALTPFAAAAGFAGALLGLLTRAPLAITAGLLGALGATRYVGRVALAATKVEQTFGRPAEERLRPPGRQQMRQQPWTWLAPAPPRARVQWDLPFWTIENSNRQLLCDLWQPPTGTAPSGLGIIYAHGSGWYLSDKDYGTRPFFHHLASEGHVVMDVAYRKSPETDVRGMLGDIKRAIAWLKQEADHYRVNPERIVLMGGSAGGHLALLAAYTAGEPELAPPNLRADDLTVRAVVSFYGPADLEGLLERHGQLASTAAAPSPKLGQLTQVPPPRRGEVSGREWQTFQLQQYARARQAFLWDLLGEQAQWQKAARLASPIQHVGSDSPPTMLIHGEHDILVPVTGARALYARLQQAGVPVVYLELPQTDHAFDLFLPRLSPPAQAALYDVERFLALQV